MVRFFSYARASLRLWRKQWVGVLIAAASLTGGFAVTILTAAYLIDGLRSDAWLETSDRLYRVEQQTLQDGEPSLFANGAATVLALGPLIPDSATGVEAVTRLRELQVEISRDTETHNSQWYAVDEGFVKAFPLPMVAGSLADVLSAPDRLALSELEAENYGGVSAIGKTIEAVIEGKKRSYQIAAIFKDIPGSSHMKPLPVITLLHEGTMPANAWMQNWPHVGTYVLRKAEGEEQVLIEGFGPSIDPLIPVDRNKRSYAHSLVNVEGMLFHSKQIWGVGTKRPFDRNFLYGLVAASVVLLGSAAFNYTTVFTGLNMVRSREIAVRRLVGAGGRQLIGMSWAEGAVFLLIVLGLSLLVAVDLVPMAERFTGGKVHLFDPGKLPLLLAAVLFVLLLALVTSFYIWRMALGKSPADLMRRAQGAVTGNGARLRQVLVFVQVCVLTMVLGLTIQIQTQTHHLLTMDRGIAQTGLMFVDGPRGKQRQWISGQDKPLEEATNRFANSFRDQVTLLGGVSSTAVSNSKPFFFHLFTQRMRNPLNNELQEMSIANVGPDYFDVAGISVLASLDEDLSKFQMGVAIEKHMLSAFGFASARDALGYDLIAEWTGSGGETIKTPYKIVAVIDSLKDKGWAKDKNILYGVARGEFTGISMLVVQYNTAQEQAVREDIEGLWQGQFHDYALNIKTIEEIVAQNHIRETDSSKAVSAIALICAILGFAGIYGMAVHWLQTRERELAIRRVMGASPKAVAFYACKKMLIPVMMGAVIAVVPAWWLGRFWLEQFVDQMPISSVTLGAAVLAIWTFAAVVLLAHVWRATQKRPASVLYHE